MSVRVIEGDCLATLRTLPRGSVHACVTSPPYWKKRDYGHDAQIGLEDHPEQFVDALAAVFDEVRRVIVPGGVAWVNLGDSYAAGGNGGGGSLSRTRQGWRGLVGRKGWRSPPPGFKDKDLTLVPLVAAAALRDAGWHLRQTVIWSKPRASEPPRADRPQVSHEFVFMLSNGAACRARNPGEAWWGQSVWEIGEAMSARDHPAPMPEELARRCIVAATAPGETVLDPFGGAGTTGVVADRLGRGAVLCELNPEYAAFARRRVYGDAPLLADVT